MTTRLVKCVLTAGLAFGIIGCPAPQQPLLHPNANAILADIDKLAAHAHLTPKRARELVNIGYTYAPFPEYNDEQSFYVAATKAYGEDAFVFASPDLAGYKKASDFDGAYKNVAIVDLTNPDGSAEYAQLGLTGQYHCVFLMHKDPNWLAAVVAVQASGNCGDQPPAGSPTISVVAEDVDKKADDVPPVARFTESTNRLPVIGLRCGDMWCLIGPDAANAQTLSLKPKDDRKARGWHDQQHLALGDPAAPSTFTASIIANSDLDKKLDDMKGKWVKAATIFVPQSNPTVPDDYLTKYGLVKGNNFLSILLSDDDGNGVALITNATYPKGILRHVSRTDNSTYFPNGYHQPATVRWGWDAHDEQIWLSCDVGCCVVEAGDGSESAMMTRRDTSAKKASKETKGRKPPRR